MRSGASAILGADGLGCFRHRRKPHFAYHLLFVFAPDVRIDFEQQRPVVLMPKPTGNSAHVDPSLEACGSKKVT